MFVSLSLDDLQCRLPKYYENKRRNYTWHISKFGEFKSLAEHLCWHLFNPSEVIKRAEWNHD